MRNSNIKLFHIILKILQLYLNQLVVKGDIFVVLKRHLNVARFFLD